MKYYIVLGIILTSMLFVVGWHDLDNAYNFKRMNIFMQEQNISYTVTDNGMILSNVSSETSHTIGLVLVFVAFFGAITVALLQDAYFSKKEERF